MLCSLPLSSIQFSAFCFLSLYFFETYVVGMRNSIARRIGNNNNNNHSNYRVTKLRKKKKQKIPVKVDLSASLFNIMVIFQYSLYSIFSTDPITLGLFYFSQSFGRIIFFNNKLIIPFRAMVTFNLNKNIA